MLKKSIVIFTALMLMISMISGAVLAAGKTGPAGKSKVGHLYLYEKDPVTWEIVDGGAWGKMKYKLSASTFKFVFNGHKLEAGLDYTLIYYPDPWPGEGLICLGSGTADDDGNVHIKGSTNTGDLPAAYDANHPDNDPEYAGAKIWLVLSGDVDCTNQKMNGWQPSEYLFEYDTIWFDDTDA